MVVLLDLLPELGNIIKYYLKCHWSPEQIVGRLLQNQICFKTIYRWINSNMINFELISCLRQKEKDRNLKKLEVSLILAVLFHNVLRESKKRNTFGHWEADTIVSSRGKSKGVHCYFLQKEITLLLLCTYA